MAMLHNASSAIVTGRVILCSPWCKSTWFAALRASYGGVVPGVGFVGGVGGNGRLIENNSGDGYVDPAESLYGSSQGFHGSLSAAHSQHSEVGRCGQLECFRAAQQGRGIEND